MSWFLRFSMALGVAAVIMTTASSPVGAQDAQAPAASSSSPSDKAWEAFSASTILPAPPASWQGDVEPSLSEIEAFRKEYGEAALKSANLARDFIKSYPTETERVAQASDAEFNMLQLAVRLGVTKETDRLQKLEAGRLSDPSIPEEQRFEIRVNSMQRKVMEKESEGMPALLATFESEVRILQKEFPNREEPLMMLLQLSQMVESDKAKVFAKEAYDKAKDPMLKEEAKTMLDRLNLLGSPLELSFAPMDTEAHGATISIASLKGKVVLVDFWATWCGPCIQELPNVKQAYAELHDKGFEILGISFDSEKQALERFVKKEGVNWPQYFDGKGWGNELGARFGINSIPSMWLVDKKGVLRDMNARTDLVDKVKKLLQEPI
jgi:thiol-disulfide isomerase/thioredoxin